MSSKCKEKYGREWSNELIDATRKFFVENSAGMVKHIGSNPHSICWQLDKVKEVEPKIYEHLVQTYLKEKKRKKQFVIFSVEDETFIGFYNSVENFIDDGWAID